MWTHTRWLEGNAWVQENAGCDALMRAQFFLGLRRGEICCSTCVPTSVKFVPWFSSAQTYALSQDLAPLVESVENAAVLLPGLGQELDDMGTIWCAGGQEVGKICYILHFPASGKTSLKLSVNPSSAATPTDHTTIPKWPKWKLVR